MSRRALLPLPPTYVYCQTSFAPAGNGLLFQLQGAAGKLVRLERIFLTGNLTTAAAGNFFVNRYSAGATGGVAGALNTIGKHDTDSPDAAATPSIWTGAPATAPLVANLRARKMFLPAPANGAGEVKIDADDEACLPLSLRGVNDFIGIQINGIADYIGVSMHLEIEWSEEAIPS